MEGCSPLHGYVEEGLHTFMASARACETRLADVRRGIP
jgi:hypothetical protein